MPNIVIVNTDGGSRQNPGHAGIGVVIKNEEGETIYAHGGYIGIATNNVAEYKALIKALEEAKNLGATEVQINMDSELIVRQMLGQYKIKEPALQELARQVKQLLTQYEKYSFSHMRREFNTEADALVNQAIDSAQV